MSARLVLNGRTVLATGAFNPRGRSRYDADRPGERGYLLPNGGVPIANAPPTPDHVFVDNDGTRYRVIDNLLAKHGWVSAATVMRWYKLMYPEVIELVLRGLLDAVVQRGSTTKHYRVLDPARVEEASKTLVSLRMSTVRKRRSAKL